LITRLFTDRTAGVSKGRYESLNLGDHVGDIPDDVAINRSILENKTAPLVFMNQSHGDVVVFVDGPTTHFPSADALVTTESNLALVVLVADCVPVLLWDESASVIAAVHVGRKGLLNGITFRALQVMRELGARNISAEFGPSICGKCYEVGKDIFDEVVQQIPTARSRETDFEFALNLPIALASQLESEKVSTKLSDICTCESASHFSYRRDGITGRTAGVIWQ
jgi:YfiH family protein